MTKKPTRLDGAVLPPPLLTPEQTAQCLGVCIQTLLTMARRGGIPSVRIGRKVMFTHDDLTAFIERSRRTRSGS